MSEQGKVAFITGAARNSGLAIARRFAAEGYHVCLSSRDLSSAQQAVDAIAREAPDLRCLPLAMDPASPGDIRRAFDAIGHAFGRLDAFVGNAAHLGVGLDTFNTTPEDWDAVMNVNARANLLCAQAALPLMKAAGGGAICFLSSVHANQSIPGRVCYSASKAALNAMTRCMAVELGHLGIRVNALIAGAIWTERWAEQSPQVTAQRRSQYPAGRESSPEDIASAVYFLCSGQSPTITGTEMTVDSGISVCLLPYQKEWRPQGR